MRIVIDGLPINAASLGIFVESALRGWDELGLDDELHLVTSPDAGIEVPGSVHRHDVDLGARPGLGRIVAQQRVVPLLARQLGADAVLGVLPTTTMAPLPCPRVVIVHDWRHELRPDQFSRAARLLRRSYSVGLRQADDVVAVSERTRQDLLAARSWLRPERVHTVLEGADHVLRWPPAAEGGPDYAVAFGQYG
ncbi:MAG TPA: glycosyltransferase, partial [Acidimicrobiales bacterium]